MPRTIRNSDHLRDAVLCARDGRISLAHLGGHTALGVDAADLFGRVVAIATGSQLAAALAMIELDGLARRLVVCPPDLQPQHRAAAFAEAEVDAVVIDAPLTPDEIGGRRVVGVDLRVRPAPPHRHDDLPTEWILFTSGTSGAPKMVVHDLAGLAGAIAPAPAATETVVWSTFYDIRRYGGLQMFLRAMLGGTRMVLSSAGEPVVDFLARCAAEGVTNISGTPSHWRSVLMRPPVPGFAPPYVRLSGEIADQAVLDGLAAAFPHARIVHAYASTEAGVGFEVPDGRAGFPLAVLTANPAVEMKIEDDTLRIRSTRTASRYLGSNGPLTDADGFVDTGDLVDVRDGRCYFAGRRGGIINVGGLKVHPEEVEAVLNRHPAVHSALVKARRNPVTGAIVTAEIVIKPGIDQPRAELEAAIRAFCRAALPPHKIPAIIRFVPALAVTAGGKLDRQHA